MAAFPPLGGCVSLFYFCLPLYIEARATQEMHFSPICRHCDSAWPMIRDRLHLLQKYHFRKQTLLSNRGEGARTVEIHPPSTCLFWRARWVQSSPPLKVPFPSLFLLRRGAAGRWKRVCIRQFSEAHPIWAPCLLCFAFLLAKERRGAELRRRNCHIAMQR